MTLLSHQISVENMFFDSILINCLFFKNVLSLPIDCPLRHVLSRKTLKMIPDLLTTCTIHLENQTRLSSERRQERR